MGKELAETVDDLQVRLTIIEAYMVDTATHKPRFNLELWIGIIGLLFGISALIIAMIK